MHKFNLHNKLTSMKVNTEMHKAPERRNSYIAKMFNIILNIKNKQFNVNILCTNVQQVKRNPFNQVHTQLCSL